ncbi:class I SAM-dependent methyltransferase [Planctomycetes bacterium K23_9]|uniref:Ubiquinone/menaquinone biosynthesis methyltransferase n=1 Tax=Stieleria marina TaxID=1930275 RepID=A0A517NPR7_9BACT|nr:ubiquinone/menaquinone biosynthesis methyltransferase [Planctomycetes bacterium K23_9]
MSAQDRTLDQYHEFMQVNAVSHLMRTARQVGIIDQLRKGQHTAGELADTLSLQTGTLALMLDALVAIGTVERYDDDYALSRAAALLCQYDEDLGDQRWRRLADALQKSGSDIDDAAHHAYVAATQWVHTPSAIQAAEILNIGGEDEILGPKILDIGGGSAVWSCAMAHQDAQANLTVVDQENAIEAARTMANSIDLMDRFDAVVGDPMTTELGSDKFDIAVIAQRVSALGDDAAAKMMKRAVQAVRPGGRVVVIDLFRLPTKPNLSEAIEALKLNLETQQGHMRSLEQGKELFAEAGLGLVQFSFLAASRTNLGLMVGVKPSSEATA